MVRLPPATASPLEVAQQLSAQGLQVFPARYRDKTPLVKWQDYQDVDASPRVEEWFSKKNRLNYWVMTGHLSGYVVIDCDTQAGEDWWRSKLPDGALDATTRVKTAKGHHYWFKLDEPLASWSVHQSEDEGGVSFDVRADKTGVIVPPSIHETGLTYEWEVPLGDALPAPSALLDGTYRRDAPRGTGDASSTATGTGGTAHSLLSRLLTQPPGGEGSGRNEWLARVAGHYAKTYHNIEELYLTHCEAANNKMGTPLDEKEYAKTVASVWKGEHERNAHRAVDASCGYLVSADTQMMCQVRFKQGEDFVYDFVEYADFDLVAKGVMLDDSDRRTYWCEVRRENRRDSSKVDTIDIVIKAETLGDERALKKQLAWHACTYAAPDNMFPKMLSPGIRIQRYLESQNPSAVTITPALGYDLDTFGEGIGAFVTHDGAITANGHVGFDAVKVRVNPVLKSGNSAPYEYGFCDTAEIARDVLEEVLTFHDETICSVFGAWWAACLLKPQIEANTSLFPFMAIEAPSESGKTNGYFAMMTQLNGNTRGEVQPTAAALRNMAAANRNGIVWVDDLDDPSNLMELLRAATSGGSLTKMAEDHESVKNTQIVAPVVISGEALGFGSQKALVDRAITITAPNPTSRLSRYDPSKPQWEDILAVRSQYPTGLHEIAGWLIQDALSVEKETLIALEVARSGSGRSAEKVAVLRAGARLLDHLVRQDDPWSGQGEHARRVESWLRDGHVDESGKAVTSNENALTLELLPWALRTWKYPQRPTQDEHGPDSPAFVKGYIPDTIISGCEIGFRVDLLAEAWYKEHHGRVQARTEMTQGLRDQAQALGCVSKRVKIAQSGGRLAYYYKLTGPVADDVVRRAMGG